MDQRLDILAFYTINISLHNICHTFQTDMTDSVVVEIPQDLNTHVMASLPQDLNKDVPINIPQPMTESAVVDIPQDLNTNVAVSSTASPPEVVRSSSTVSLDPVCFVCMDDKATAISRVDQFQHGPHGCKDCFMCTSCWEKLVEVNRQTLFQELVCPLCRAPACAHIETSSSLSKVKQFLTFWLKWIGAVMGVWATVALVLIPLVSTTWTPTAFHVLQLVALGWKYALGAFVAEIYHAPQQQQPVRYEFRIVMCNVWMVYKRELSRDNPWTRQFSNVSICNSWFMMALVWSLAMMGMPGYFARGSIEYIFAWSLFAYLSPAMLLLAPIVIVIVLAGVGMAMMMILRGCLNVVGVARRE